AELRDLGGVGRHGDEVPGDRALVAERMQRPLARTARECVIVSSVVKVFDDTMNKVSAGSRSCVASAKSVPSTFVRQHWADLAEPLGRLHASSIARAAPSSAGRS